jgi:hypothetical protein
MQASILAGILTPKISNNNLSKVSQAACKQDSSLYRAYSDSDLLFVTSRNILYTYTFKCHQMCSIGFKLGEYRGQLVIIIIPRSRNHSCILCVVCIEALSYINVYLSSNPSKIGSTSTSRTLR